MSGNQSQQAEAQGCPGGTVNEQDGFSLEKRALIKAAILPPFLKGGRGDYLTESP
jgi:hypothetical protein